MEGKISFGPYELLGRLSAGGTAEVHRAKDPQGRLVALKTIPAAGEDEEVAQMFEDEARIASSLDHPNVARVLAYGVHEGRMFIAYELVDGKDLRVVFENASLTGERLPLPIVVTIVAQLAEALAHAHSRDSAIVHRDVSPQNVVVSFDGDVKLIDFGIAKAKGRISKTAAGTIKGKFGYMSPEQVRGEEVDQRTDVFSLGICAWELLTLKRLFLPTVLGGAEGSVNEILVLDLVKNHFPDPPSSFLAEVPRELDRIVMKALAKNPDERYKSARELYRDLNGFIEKTGLHATRDDVAEMMRRTFGATRTGRIMELQETRMSDENKGGSDLDIFEGLGKKNSERNPAAPPPPPGSGAHVAAKPAGDMKKTLLGIPGPAASSPTLPGEPAPVSARPPAPPSGSMRAAQPSSPPATPSKPPPPPGRGSLPNLAATQPSSQPPQVAASASPSQAPSATQRVSSPPPIPAPASTRPGPAGLPAGATSSSSTPVAAKKNGGKLDMDWDDDDEATHVFDKDKEKSAPSVTSTPPSTEPERASMDQILSSPPPAPRASSQMPAAPPAPLPAAGSAPPPPVATATLSGAFGALGQTNGSSSAFKSGAPPSQSMRSAPPPPPPASGIPSTPSAPPVRSASTSTHPMPPPPPPGQTTTAPMHMPPTALGQQRPVSAPPPARHSAPPQAQSVPPQPQLPPVSRNMEATAVVPRAQQGSKAGVVIGLLVAVMAIAAAAVFLLMPRTATLVVNVADNKGAPVKGLEVSVDDKQVCTSSPCIVPNVTAGVHSVKVAANGYEPLAPLAVTVEARKDLTKDFTLTPSKAVSGTGFKVAGNQPGVKLIVDGKDVGPLPQEMRDLEPGEHKLKFVGGDRYAPLEKTISVAKDEIVDVGSVSLKVLKGKATIQLGTPGAKVYLVLGTNRKEVPQFPMGIEFDPNERWVLEATAPGMEDYKQPITWDDGQAEKTFTVTLTPKGQAPVAAAPTHATTPAAPAQPAAAPAKPAAAPASFLKGEQGGGETAKAEAPKKEAPAAAAGGEAFLNINSLPASTVVLDGKPLGPTPKLKVSVTPGQHTILFVNAEQSLKKSISVDVKAGETKAAFAKLRE